MSAIGTEISQNMNTLINIKYDTYTYIGLDGMIQRVADIIGPYRGKNKVLVSI